MGFYFRKSVNFGPVRLNFSKSGVGVSVGVKGARISTGPRGTYVHVGSNGFYYRQRLDTASPQTRRHVPQQPYVPSPTSSAHVIATADVSRLVDTSSADTLQQINTRARQMRYTPFVIIATLLATISVYLLIDFCATAFTNRWSSKHEKVVSVNNLKTPEAKNSSIEEAVTANDRRTLETKDSTSTMIPGKSVGQIILGMTKEEVVRALGKPAEVSSEGVVYKSKKTGNYLKIHLAGDGCDRAIPNELRSLLPGLRHLRPLLLSHRHGLRRQVPLRDVLPNATKPDHPKGQDDLSACDGPCHA